MKHLETGDATLYEVRICEIGHHNPPDFPKCRVCGAALDETVNVANPKVGWVRSSDGQTVALEGTILVGRAPETHGIRGVNALTSPPELVEISRQHVRIDQEGWQVSVTDLGSNNGTLLQRSGGDTVNLTPHRAYNVQPGDVLQLGETYSLKFEV